MKLKAWLGSAAGVAGGSLVLLAVAAPAATAVSRQPASPRTRDLIYVANADSGPVTVYAAHSHGQVKPVATIRNPGNQATVWDPWGVTFGKSGHLFVQSFLSDATTFVYPPGAHGAARPSRIFEAQAPDNQSIAVDSKGFQYIAGGEATEDIAVVRPGASGRPRDFYAVNPVRTIPLDASWNPWPSVLAVNTKNQILVAVLRPQGNAIEIFNGGAHGRPVPVRVISGPRTRLGSCGCDEVSVAFSARTGLIYAAVSDGASAGTHISVFAGDATGDARPIRTISGPATGLAGKLITGITCSQSDGTIYAMVKSAQFITGRGRVEAYAGNARGDVRPLWSFTDRRTRFTNAQGITVSVAHSG